MYAGKIMQDNMQIKKTRLWDNAMVIAKTNLDGGNDKKVKEILALVMKMQAKGICTRTAPTKASRYC